MPQTNQLQPIIRMKDVTKVFISDEMETHALRGVSLDIMAGDYISISGPSGCGKSTLLSVLGLIDSPTSGEYWISGTEVSQLSVNEQAEVRNRKVGFIYQSFNLIDELSVFENVALPLTYREPAVSKATIEKKVMECLEIVQMAHRVSHKPNQLSGGQQQRVAIARALVGDPDVLLVDEPTGNLDSKNGDKVMEMLAELNSKGTTICMVTHDPRYANMARKQLHLLDGKLLQEQAMKEVI